LCYVVLVVLYAGVQKPTRMKSHSVGEKATW